MYRHYTAVRSVPRKLRAIEKFSHKGESVKRGSTVVLYAVPSTYHVMKIFQAFSLLNSAHGSKVM